MKGAFSVALGSLFLCCICAFTDIRSPSRVLEPRLVDALVVGGGPAGLGAAICLARDGVDVTLVERRATGQSFEPQLAYLYLVDGRGQRFTDCFGLTEELQAKGVDNGGLNMTLIYPNEDRGVNSAVPMLASAGPRKQDSQKETEPKAGVWIARKNFLDLLDAEAERVGVKRLYGASLEGLAMDRDTPDGYLVDAKVTQDGQEMSIKARLVLGCDGLNSSVRRAMKNWYAEGKVAVTSSRAKGSRGREAARLFDPVPLPSPSTGLRYRMLLFPPDFQAENLKTGKVFSTYHERAYVFPGKDGPASRQLRLGLLPSKDPRLPRTANIIRRRNHAIWKCQTGEDLLTFLQGEFPQLDIRSLVSMEQAESFVGMEPKEFPPPQFVRGLHMFLRDGSKTAGIALLGDCIHAFPPDIGQGVNAALEDVMDFRDCLLGDPRNEVSGPRSAVSVVRNPDLLQKALSDYQEKRAPEAEAVARIAQVGFPYQYRQSPRMEKLFFLGFLFRNVLSLAAKRVGLGRLFTKPVILQIQSQFGVTRYADAWKRAQRTTCAFFLTVIGFVAPIAQTVLETIFV